LENKLFTPTYSPLAKKSAVLFLVIWLHITLLDLFYVNHNGVVFLWQENSELKTLLIHLMIATLTVFFYFGLTMLLKFFAHKGKSSE
jgi:hypothetical protein